MNTVFPATSRCWSCGRFAQVTQAHGFRWCPHCEVRWLDRLIGTRPMVALALSVQQTVLSAKWPLRQGAEYADKFDTLVDHGEVSISCPA